MSSGYVYHIGYLPSDRKESPKLDKLATQYMRQANAGEVRLIQRRVDDHHYEYIVVPVTLR